MRIFILLVLLLMILSQPLFAEPADLSLQMDLLQRETSKDSNSQIHLLSIEGRQVIHHYQYKGFPKESSREKEFVLSEGLEQQVMTIVNKHLLGRKIHEIKPTDHLGISIELHVKVKMGQESGEALIQGMYRDWQQREQPSNIESLDYYSAVLSLLALFSIGK